MVQPACASPSWAYYAGFMPTLPEPLNVSRLSHTRRNLLTCNQGGRVVLTHLAQYDDDGLPQSSCALGAAHTPRYVWIQFTSMMAIAVVTRRPRNELISVSVCDGANLDSHSFQGPDWPRPPVAYNRPVCVFGFFLSHLHTNMTHRPSTRHDGARGLAFTSVRPSLVVVRHYSTSTLSIRPRSI